MIFQEKLLKVLKCCSFLWVQRRPSCSPAASFANCVMTLYLLKVHLQTFHSLPITKERKNFWVVTLLSQMSDILYWLLNTTEMSHLGGKKKQNSLFSVWKFTDSVVKQWHWLCMRVCHIEAYKYCHTNPSKISGLQLRRQKDRREADVTGVAVCYVTPANKSGSVHKANPSGTLALLFARR